jgi:hypothetical protein
MSGITTYLTILTLNVNGLNSPSKDTDWQIGLKSKTQQYVVYKNPTLLTEINIALE